MQKASFTAMIIIGREAFSESERERETFDLVELGVIGMIIFASHVITENIAFH